MPIVGGLDIVSAGRSRSPTVAPSASGCSQLRVEGLRAWSSGLISLSPPIATITAPALKRKKNLDKTFVQQASPRNSCPKLRSPVHPTPQFLSLFTIPRGLACAYYSKHLRNDMFGRKLSASCPQKEINSAELGEAQLSTSKRGSQNWGYLLKDPNTNTDYIDYSLNSLYVLHSPSTSPPYNPSPLVGVQTRAHRMPHNSNCLGSVPRSLNHESAYIRSTRQLRLTIVFGGLYWVPIIAHRTPAASASSSSYY